MPQKIPCPGAREILHTILERAITTPNETASVFVAYHAHTCEFQVHYYAGGWINDAAPDWTEHLYLDNDDDQYVIKALINILDRLEDALGQSLPDHVLARRIAAKVDNTIAAFVPPTAPAEALDLATIPMDPCAACGTLCDGEWTIEDDHGNELPLCDTHGGPDAPDITTVRALIARKELQPC